MARRIGAQTKRVAGKVPWALVAQAAVILNKRWRALSRRERERASTLVRSSKGRPGKLSAKERAELRGLLAKLDLRRLGGELALLRRGRAGRRLRGRRRP
jgi:hypothetical protein